MVLVPSRGANIFENFGSEDADFYRVLGGFAEGDIIKCIKWSWYAVTAAEIILAATLGGSRSETIGGLEAGADLLDRSTRGFLTGSKVRSYRFSVIAGGSGWHQQAVGRQVEVGANFITLGFAVLNSLDVSVTAAVEVVRVAKGGSD